MGPLVIDFFSQRDGLTVATGKVMLKLYLKRAKAADDRAPLVEMRTSVPVSKIGDPKALIGEFSLTIEARFDYNNKMNER
mmetsp:Transcript_34710/g.53263  ORF Transcript_34710/g.53263 Transcript_34710/m.53263 type:complete len:80 (+) Transcript_34710:382-621(+)